MSDLDEGDRKTDPDTLPAMAEAIRRIDANAHTAADYSIKAYELASQAHRYGVGLPVVALAVALIALACAAVR